MPAVGGSIESVNLDGRDFAVAADAEGQRKLGGFENEVQANGDGETARLIKTRVPLMVEGLTLEVDNDRGDQEFLQELADAFDFFAGAVTYADGTVWQGNVAITGELKYNSANATASVSLSGPGKLVKQ